MTQIANRKLAHLDLCSNEDVESIRTSLLEEVQLFHDAIPELSFDEIDTSICLFGRELRVPILVSGMTGGTDRAGEINRALASAAQQLGFGMGLGSQRPMLENPELAASYAIRDVAPDVLLLANLGCVQARGVSTAQVAELVEAVAADALCIHLNVAQELVQDEGDRDFRGCCETLARLVAELPVPVIAKETGCGLSPESLFRLSEAGIAMVDVAGVGGTTWPGVESLRGSARQRALGQALREWGIPTAASLIYAQRTGVAAIASGGIRSAQDVVRALALGARAVGLALPFLRAHESRGRTGIIELGEALALTVRALMLLVGARNVTDLRSSPVLLGPTLAAWTHEELPRTRATARERPGTSALRRRDIPC